MLFAETENFKTAKDTCGISRVHSGIVVVVGVDLNSAEVWELKAY